MDHSTKLEISGQLPDLGLMLRLSHSCAHVHQYAYQIQHPFDQQIQMLFASFKSSQQCQSLIHGNFPVLYLMMCQIQRKQPGTFSKLLLGCLIDKNLRQLVGLVKCYLVHIIPIQFPEPAVHELLEQSGSMLFVPNRTTEPDIYSYDYPQAKTCELTLRQKSIRIITTSRRFTIGLKYPQPHHLNAASASSIRKSSRETPARHPVDWQN
ncbi:MAG: hypothetical protein J0I60_06160 [Nitrosospira sp.]|nr:hypothetical protein [Nitrosospira sp.]